jgi:hypothetical protein
MDNADKLIAKILGSPIDPNLPVPFALDAIVDTETLEPGEPGWYPSADDSNVDEVYTIAGNGALTEVNISPVAPALIATTGMVSKHMYILLEDLMKSGSSAATQNVDQSAFARVKAAITRSMDKLEVRRVLAGINGGGISSQAVTQDSGEDIYDVIVKMVHLVEDYGDNYVLLVGSTVKELIDTYDKDNADNFNYRVGMQEMLKNFGITVIKVTGTVKTTGDSSAERLLAVNRAVLVARDSSLKKGKPIAFVRRKFSAEIAANAGVSPDNLQRIVVVDQTPTNIAGANTVGYGCFGYENNAFVILNKRAIAYCNAIA